MTVRTKYHIFEDVIYDIKEEEYIEQVCFKAEEFGETDQIAADKLIVKFPTLGLAAREGIYLTPDDKGNLIPDWSLTLIYDINEEDPSKYLYLEQDGISCSLHNFMISTGRKEIIDDDTLVIIEVKS